MQNSIQKKIVISGGGHNLAAGLLLKKNNINLLKKFLENTFDKKSFSQKSTFIQEISISAINKNFIKNINKIAPFGNQNSNPCFLIKNIKIINPIIINDKYISFFIKSSSGKMIKGISFHPIKSSISMYLLNYKKSVNLILRINENTWNNKSNVNIHMVDLIIDSNNT